MIITLTKFGTVLTSRQAGKEAYSAFLPTLTQVTKEEDVIVDFEGISTFSPSWGDEFLTPLQKKYGDRLILRHTTNPSAALTIDTLANINHIQFRISET